MSRRLYFDIEVSYNVTATWRTGRDQYIGHHQVLKEAAIICICYKWENDREIYSFTWDKNQSDKAMLVKFVKVLEQADEIVGHNGDGFDLKWIRGRCMKHRIPCMPAYVTIDTLKQSRAAARHNSHSLDFLGGYFGVGRKKDVKFETWIAICEHKCPKAMDRMVKYCKQDVKLLQDVHRVMIPYTKAKTHRGMLNGGARIDCPECGSPDYKINQHRITGAGVRVVQLQCKACGKFHNVPDTTFNAAVNKRKDEAGKAKERLEAAARINRSLNENARR